METLLTGKAEVAFKTKKRELLAGASIFVVCLAADLTYNLLLSQPGRLHIFDSSHYVQAGLYLMIAIEHAFGAASSPPANLGQMLLLDGFGMPFCAAIAALISANKMTSAALILVQSTVIALTAVATYTCALRMKLGVAWSVAAGLLWALYPAAIVSAGTFLSEPLSGLLVCGLALAAITCWQEPKPRHWFAFGFVSGAIMVTKPALLIYLSLVLLIMALGLRTQILGLGRQILKQLTVFALSTILGAFLAILPWMIVTAAFTGQPEIMPSRLPSTNMALGCDYEIGFWETMPVPPLTLNNYARNPIRVFYELATEHTFEMPEILSKKFARLYFAPFNDFHDSVFGINYFVQRLLHALLLVLGLAGVLAILASQKASADEKFGIALVTANLATHCCYMPFESLPRYAFSAMPLLFIAAICMVRKVVTDRDKSSILFATAALALTIACAGAQFDDVQTKVYVLNQGETAKRQTASRATKANTNSTTNSCEKPAWVALITDANLNNRNCKIKFNGQEIEAKAINLRSYPSGFQHQSTIDDIQNLLSRTSNVEVEKLAHYSMIALPIEVLRSNQENTIEVTAQTPLTIFGQKLQAEKDFRLIPALRYFSVTKMFASESGLDGRAPDHRIVLAAKSSNTVRGKELASDEDLRLFLLVSPQPNPIIDAQAGHASSTLRLW